MNQIFRNIVMASLTTVTLANSFSPRSQPWKPLEQRQNPTPTVDLGYAVHQATLNSTGNYYRFGNIRFGEAPLGDLRFAAPVPPQSIDRTLNTGDVDYQCPSANPAWTREALIHMYYKVVPALPVYSPYTAVPGTPGATVQEDCLFLDVIVPAPVLDDHQAAAGDCQCSSKNPGGTPVLVYIQGGSFTTGSKTSNGDPSGLMLQSMRNGDPGMIYVSINYRLGLFGWLAGDKFKSEGGLPNAGLYDQRLALEWVQTYIHLFGGDPDKVTVMGVSSGAGSILHHITSNGGQGTNNFNQAFLQSPGFTVVAGMDQQEAVYSDFLTAAGITSLAEARAMDTNTLQLINYNIIGNASYGIEVYGPVVDGTFVTDYPGALLLAGSYDHNVKMFTGHTRFEGAGSANIYVSTEAGFYANLQWVFPHMSTADLTTLTTVLYPPVYDGTFTYTTLFDRLSLIIAESEFICNEFYAAEAFSGSAYSYYFDMAPGFHGFDIPYSFYNGPAADSFGNPINATVATTLQNMITTFVTTGNPNAADVPHVPIYGAAAQQVDLSATGFGTTTDTAANARCLWWQTAPWASS